MRMLRRYVGKTFGTHCTEICLAIFRFRRSRTILPRMELSVINIKLLGRAAFCLGVFWSKLSFGAAAWQLPVQDALAGVTTNRLLAHIEELASDRFEGRAPGTGGERLSVDYLTRQFKEIGLTPGNPNGTYVQQVPLVGFRATPAIEINSDNERMRLSFPDDAVVWSRRFVPEVKVEDSDIIFVGYGIVAPEYGWDDYKGVDVRGKTILMLINDPPIPDPNDSSKLDEKMFKGRAMTYYGRWTYKYEIATQKGAAAAIIIHETEPAAYPWAVVQGSNSRENFDLQTADKNATRVAIEGWITHETAQRLCSAAGTNYEALKRAAVRKEFRPMPLPLRASIQVKNTLREISSTNVVAKLEGSDPRLKDEYVVYTAHWDHLGRDPSLAGDQVFNGAVDNATGCAALLEMARAFSRAKPRRSVLFVALTAEEKGLLGAKYYTTHPLYPLKQTLADINMDAMNVWGRTRDIEVVGAGQSTLEDTLRKMAVRQEREVVPEAEPEKGSYFRSDHFEFAKQGVPALNAKSGIELIGQPSGFGLERRKEYGARDYHKVSDEIKPGWDLSGLVEDVQLLFLVGHSVAEENSWPEWKPESEFKGRR
jgi:Zn-dependent M28 family amino/carboxypeptidase